SGCGPKTFQTSRSSTTGCAVPDAGEALTFVVVKIRSFVSIHRRAMGPATGRPRCPPGQTLSRRLLAGRARFLDPGREFRLVRRNPLFGVTTDILELLLTFLDQKVFGIDVRNRHRHQLEEPPGRRVLLEEIVAGDDTDV